jgi:uncharacterized protein (DUF1697 family)
MKKYLALLRGVNVSGKNLIKMKDFQAILQENGLDNVTTYIQSGNIIFESQLSDNKEVENKISQLISKKYGFDVPVIILTLTKLENLIEYNPFSAEANEEPTKVLISFFTDLPSTELINKFKAVNYETERFKFEGKYAYLYCMNGYGKAKINNNFFENKLKVKATTRNWKTVLKLFEMMTNS